MQALLTNFLLRFEVLDIVASQQDSVVSHMRHVEQGLRTEMINMKKALLESTGQKHIDEQVQICRYKSNTF